VHENGLLLSEGLTSRIIAETGRPVSFDVTVAADGGGGTESVHAFHEYPDAAAVFCDDETRGYKYVSNSEFYPGRFGGVGAIAFDADNRIVGYEPLMSNVTERNCGGGATFWNTWLSCEEIDGGRIWEVDPFNRQPPRATVMGYPQHGGEWESAAYDNRDTNQPVFYVTSDSSSKPVLRFTPDPDAVKAALSTGDYSELLHTPGTNEYLKLNWLRKTFTWTTNYWAARISAALFYPGMEGISKCRSQIIKTLVFSCTFTSFPHYCILEDFHEGRLYMVSKSRKQLFILNLDCNTFTATSTESGAFDGEPDQLVRLSGQEGRDRILYFCEDGSSKAGVHARDSQGRFFTILQSNDPSIIPPSAATGLAFSPDNTRMFVAFQDAGKVFEIRRTDGRDFGGEWLDILYHGDSNPDAFD
jgi:hypothetical protein